MSTDSSTRIGRNLFALFSSQLVTWLLTFTLTVFLPRYLGARGAGMLILASSTWAIAAVLIGFGLDLLVTKEVARHPERTSALVGRVLVVRLGLFAIVFLAIVAYVHVAGYSAETRRVIYVVGISTIIWQWIGALQAALFGLEQMHYMAVANVAGKAVNTAVALILLVRGAPVIAIAGVLSLAALVTFAIEFVYLNRLHPIRLTADGAAVKSLMRGGLPYLGAALALVAYQQTDVIIMSWLVDERELGWYGASQQLFGTLLFVPTVVMSAVLPAMSRSHERQSDDLFPLVRRCFDLLLVVAVPIGFGTLVVADPFVLLLFGPDFKGSGPILALMGIVLILSYQNMLVGTFMTSMDRQNRWTAVVAGSTVLTAIIDLAAVPYCQRRFGNGALGGAISFIVTEVVMLFLGLALLPKGALGRSNVVTAVKTTAAGLVMIAATWWSRPYFIAVPILIGMITYPITLFVLGALPREEWKVLTGALGQRFRRRAPV